MTPWNSYCVVPNNDNDEDDDDDEEDYEENDEACFLHEIYM